MGFSLEVRFCVGVFQEREKNARDGKGAIGSGFFKILPAAYSRQVLLG